MTKQCRMKLVSDGYTVLRAHWDGVAKVGKITSMATSGNAWTTYRRFTSAAEMDREVKQLLENPKTILDQ